MLRRCLVLSSLAFSLLLFELPTAEARIVNRGNPSAHANVHGINYGSMRWERRQGYRRALFSSSRSHRRWARRR